MDQRGQVFGSGLVTVPDEHRDRLDAEPFGLRRAQVEPVPEPAREPEPGLGVLPWLRVLPHFDRMRSWAPELAARAAAGAPPGTTAIGIDEDTAIVDLTGGGRSWQVHGRQQAWVLNGRGGGGQPHPAGAFIKIDLYK